MKTAYAVLGRIRWGTRWGGVHHVAHRLAERHPVCYLELPAKPGRRLRIRRRRVAGGLVALTDPDWPLQRFGAVRRRRAGRIARALRRELPGRDHALVALLHAGAPLDLARALRPELTVYRATDDFSENTGYRAWEEEALEVADLTLAVSRPLTERLAGAGRARYLPNGVDDALLDGSPDETSHPALSHLPRPIVGFAGCIRPRRLDLELVARLAAERPEWSFVFAGDVAEDAEGDSAGLFRSANVHHVELVPREEVGRLVATFDAALLPYRDSILNRACFPLKALDALAAGRAAVMSPRRPDLSELRGHLDCAADPDSLLGALDAAVAAARDPERAAARRRAVEPFRWSRITARLEEAVAEALEEC